MAFLSSDGFPCHAPPWTPPSEITTPPADAVISATSSAIVAYHLTNGVDTANASPYTTGSITPTADRLVLCAVLNTATAAAGAVSVAGCGLTWAEVATVQYNTAASKLYRLSVWRAMGSAPTSGALTITVAGSPTGCAWSVTEFSGADTSGTNGSGAIVQSATNATDAATSCAVTLSSFASVDNATYAAYALDVNTAITPDATPGGWTELSDDSLGSTPAARLEAGWNASNDTAPTSTFSSSDNAGIAIEIKAGSATEYTNAGRTLPWLQEQGAHDLAFTLVIDGYDYAATTTSDVDGMSAAYASTDWSNIHRNLGIAGGDPTGVGSMQQSITILDPKIEADTMTFTLVDDDGTLAASGLFAPSLSSANRTEITTDIDPDSGYVSTKDAAAFDASGNVYLGTEGASYETVLGSPATRFAVMDRGKWSVFGTQAQPGRFPRNHRLSKDSAGGAKNADPTVSSVPRNFWNRVVGLYVHHRVNSTWSTKTQAWLAWAGRIKEWGYDGNGKVTLTCQSVKEMLFSSVFTEQFKATLGEPFVLTDADQGIKIKQYASTASGGAGSINNDITSTTWGVDGTTYETPNEIVGAVQEQIQIWQDAGTIDSETKWSIEIRDTSDGPRTVIRCEVSSAVTATSAHSFQFYLARHVLRKLGYDASTHPVVKDSNGRYIARVDLGPADSTTVWEAVSSFQPWAYLDPSKMVQGQEFRVVDATGEWVTQTTMPPLYDDAEGFLQVGDTLVACTFDGVDKFTIQRFLTQHTPGDAVTGITNEGKSPDVRQVWIERDVAAGRIMLQLMLSTGTEGFNHPTYDVYPYGNGLGLPATMVDIETFEGIGDAFSYELALVEPKPFREILESLLAVTGRFLIWKNGKLSLTYPGYDNPNTAEFVELTEANKADPNDRPAIKYSADSIVNVLKLRYGTSENVPLRTQSNGGRLIHHETITAEFQASISDFGQRKTAEINAPGLLSPDDWVRYVMAPAGSYFSRPVAAITRSYNASLIHMVPGDIVKLTDDAIIDPRTGTQGVAGLAGFVTETRFDWASMRGTVTFAFLPEHDASKYATYSPSALIDYDAYNGGYNAAGPYIQLKPHAFSRSSEDADVTHFDAGDTLRYVEYSPADPLSPVRDVFTVDTVDEENHRLYLTGTLGSWDSSLKYVVEAQGKSACQTSQQDHAFIADDADNSTGYADDDANIYSGAANTYNPFVLNPSYTTEFIVPADSSSSAGVSTVGNPYSARKPYQLAESLNNFLGYKCCQVVNDLPNHAMGNYTEIVGDGTSYLVHGPLMIPLYDVNAASPRRRSYGVKVRICRTAGTGSAVCQVISSSQLVTGSATNSTAYAPGYQVLTFSTTSSSYEWTTEQLLTPQVRLTAFGHFPVTLFTVEMLVSAGTTMRFGGVSIREVNL